MNTEKKAGKRVAAVTRDCRAFCTAFLRIASGEGERST
jgi:hypothetical protein